jgi:nucleotide-binding universal stress UspA family protein
MTSQITPTSELHEFTATHAGPGPMIVAVDFADGESALRVANSLAPHSPKGVLAVTVLPPLSLYALGIDPVLVPPQIDLERKSAHLERLRKQVYQVVGTSASWECRVLYDDPSRGLAELAASTHSPLIVMGIGRHRPLDRIVGAETTIRTVRHGHCPVLAVTHDATAPMQTVVITTDFSARSARAAESVLPLLAPNATLHILHVWERIALLGDRSEALNEVYEKTIPDRFQRFFESLALPAGITLSWAARAGRPAAEILSYADDIQADLIVAGRHERGAFATFLEGSVTQALLRGAERSVLITPEPSFADLDRLSRLLTGASISKDRAEWPAQLEGFTRRNTNRRTIVEIDELSLGAQVQESGYRLLGAAYDPHDKSVELMLGSPRSDKTHVSRRITDVESVTVASDAHGQDIALSIRHGGGQTLLTFYPD